MHNNEERGMSAHLVLKEGRHAEVLAACRPIRHKQCMAEDLAWPGADAWTRRRRGKSAVRGLLQRAGAEERGQAGKNLAGAQVARSSRHRPAGNYVEPQRQGLLRVGGRVQGRFIIRH